MNEQSTTHTTTPVDASRQVVASFRDYADAERAVDRLADSRFPVERVSIVGEGLELVEQVTGRLTLDSVAGMRAERYDVLVDAAVPDEARRLLRDLAGEPKAPVASTSSRSDS